MGKAGFVLLMFLAAEQVYSVPRNGQIHDIPYTKPLRTVNYFRNSIANEQLSLLPIQSPKYRSNDEHGSNSHSYIRTKETREMNTSHSKARMRMPLYNKKKDSFLNDLNDFEFVVPSVLDSNGRHVRFDLNSHVHQIHKRSTYKKRNHSILYIGFSAFGKEFRLNLTQNNHFISSNYFLEMWNHGRKIRSKRKPHNSCHYVGHLNSMKKSRVALSTCSGLHGLLSTEDGQFFIVPLSNMTMDPGTGKHIHVVHKKSHLKKFHNEKPCGVNEKMHKTFEQGLKTLTSQRHTRRKRRSLSSERTVEVLVVADEMMVDYHGKAEIESYLLAVMNIVAMLFHDESIGNMINIVVTRLIVLSEKQTGLEINHHADHTLESFCRWQQWVNSVPSGNAGEQYIAHHDNAILITRFDICTYKNEPCGTLGLAPVSGMCQSDRSCSINEDIGLASAFTIAHEIGHNFGMQHDGIGNQCGPAGGQTSKIMAAELTKNTQLFSWSDCSRQYITEFLDSGLGHCLNNLPSVRGFEQTTQLPGQVHDSHQQCVLRYGAGSQTCRWWEICGELWCQRPGGQCETDHLPAAEGTDCPIKNQSLGRCYHGQCVSYHWLAPNVDGSWGAWSQWGSCSRTCDGGVSTSERQCDNPKPKHMGKYCIGERKRFRACSLEDCPANSTDYREIQCKGFNHVPFRGRYFEWKAYRGGIAKRKPCALVCLAVGYNFYTERSPRVVDGTRCHDDTYDMCVYGKCQSVGCDRVLGSTKVEDKCRVCGGDNSSCKTMDGVFSISFVGMSDYYQQVLTIPKGAVHIRIAEKKFSRSYLAIKSIGDNKYYINGAKAKDWPEDFEFANTLFHYERMKEKPESITALGPTTMNLLVVVFLHRGNTSIDYQYNIPHDSQGYDHVINSEIKYEWKLSNWSHCSKSCGHGVSRVVSMCVMITYDMIVETPVNPSLCGSSERPKDKSRVCNVRQCPPEWTVGEWNACSLTCGTGKKTRKVRCGRRINALITKYVPRRLCADNAPVSEQSCSLGECPSHWVTDGWGECKAKCGPGVQVRSVLCVSSAGENRKKDSCSALKPPTSTRTCNAGPCLDPSARWSADKWSKCSATCNLGHQRRMVKCVTENGDISTGCKTEEAPVGVRKCKITDCRTLLHEHERACKDVSNVAYCPLVLRLNFCDRSYFRQMCCRTCEGHRKS